MAVAIRATNRPAHKTRRKFMLASDSRPPAVRGSVVQPVSSFVRTTPRSAAKLHRLRRLRPLHLVVLRRPFPDCPPTQAVEPTAPAPRPTAAPQQSES